VELRMKRKKRWSKKKLNLRKRPKKSLNKRLLRRSL
jgi:hypothetical protein